MQRWARCRAVSADVTDVVHSKLPLMNAEFMGSFKRIGLFSGKSSYRERFLARARKQGLSVSPRSGRDSLWTKLGIGPFPWPAYVQVAATAMVLLMAAVGILSYSLSESNARYRTLVADMEVMSKQISQEAGIARSPVQQARSESPSSLDTTPRPPAGAPPETNAGLIKAR